MRSALRITLGLIALGAATSVLVAWGCFVFLINSNLPAWRLLAPTEWRQLRNDSHLMEWKIFHRYGTTTAQLHMILQYPYARRVELQSDHIGWELHEFLSGETTYMPSSRSDMPRVGSVIGPVRLVQIFGWPWRCTARRIDYTVDYGLPSWTKVEPVNRHSAFLPMTPIFRGLLLNTAFYAALWAVPLVLLPAFIRWRRARRGGCPSCGYDTTGLETCPECGLVLASTENTAAS